MWIPSIFFFLFASHCICLFSSANCKEQLIRDGNSEHLNPNLENSPVHGRVITLEKKPAANSEAFDKFPAFRWKYFGQKSIENITSKNQQVRSSLKNKNVIYTDKLRSIIFVQPERAGFQKNEQLPFRKLNRRSVQSSQTKKEERNTYESGFPRQAFNLNGKLSLDPRIFSFFLLFCSLDDGEDQHSGKRQADAETFRGTEERMKNCKVYFDNLRDFNLSSLLPLENGFLEIVDLPSQLIRKIFDFLFNMIKLKPKNENENQLLRNNRIIRKFFEYGKDALNNMKENVKAANVGIHNAVKMGPLSVNFDVGKS
ncbi:hypothetical protein K0M31_016019 [Melipona bicolor]|uniref:Uncharacterized protein n=1 Tax=Melipona bicolor TaxID=60889 RepID=A0AA40G6E7_9HYME|nr:hypothetical protein K0M31_016019 [Melipona bicolor]